MINDRALITGACGGREIYLERTATPEMHLLQGLWRLYPVVKPDILAQVIHQDRSSKIVQVSDNLPALIAGAYSPFSRKQLSEALIDSWIVIEQLLDWYWMDHISQVNENGRKDRLEDSRTYTAAVRTEILYTKQIFPKTIYQSLIVSRQHRNDLAHRAHVNLKMASETVEAMRKMIEFYCGFPIEPLLTSNSINW